MYHTKRSQQQREAIARIRMEAKTTAETEGVGDYLMWLEDQLLAAREAVQKEKPPA
jgi:hypothetical protein